MRRGDIVWVDFEPVSGSEANKTRPAVVVSNDGLNQTVTRLGRGVVTVVPLTSNVTRLFSFQVLMPAAVTGLAMDSKAQAEQLRAVDAHRCGETIGTVPPHLMAELDEALRLHLSL